MFLQHDDLLQHQPRAELGELDEEAGERPGTLGVLGREMLRGQIPQEGVADLGHVKGHVEDVDELGHRIRQMFRVLQALHDRGLGACTIP